VPMDVWRQWIRHRTANVTEYSTRYSEAIDAAQRTRSDGWRRQSSSNRQGSAGLLETAAGERLSAEEADLHDRARNVYKGRLAAGVAREQARKDLPLSTYTEAYWKIDLHNLLHFLDLRLDVLAQEEIRSYARIIGEDIVARWVPLAWEAFLDYRRHAVRLSRLEALVVKSIAAGKREEATAHVKDAGLLEHAADGRLAPSRERRDLEVKLRDLGFTIPWG